MLAFNSAIRRGDADLPHGKGEANSLPRGTLSETPAPSRSGNSSLPPPPQPIGLREAAGRGPAPRGGGVGGGGVEAAHRRPRLPRAQRPTPPARSPPRPRAARSPPPAPRTHSPPSSSSSSAATPRARRAIWASPSSSTSTHSPLGLIPPLLSPLRSAPARRAPCLPACRPATRRCRRSPRAPLRSGSAAQGQGARHERLESGVPGTPAQQPQPLRRGGRRARPTEAESSRPSVRKIRRLL